MRGKWSGLLVFAMLLVASCTAAPNTGSDSAGPGGSDAAPDSATDTDTATDPAPDAAPGSTSTALAEVPLPDGAAADVDRAVRDVAAFIGEPTNPVDPAVFGAVAAHGDERLAWVLADMGQFVFRGEAFDALLAAGTELTGGEYTIRTWWKGMSDELIADDVPAPPGYLEWKRRLLGAVDVTWLAFLDDPSAQVDWRLVTFGGVLADTRPFGSPETCSCIPALDDPPAVPAADGDWYPDHRTVLGVSIDGESRAYPLNILEIHELVNDELGGRRFSLTYCTLCRSGVAYYVDDVPAGVEPPVLRTSGLLQRSNKLVFDRESDSYFNQFTGTAISGPLAEAGVVLPRITVVTSTWADWQAAHPETTLMAGKDGNGPNYPLDPLGDRDAGGPIFPIGDVDDTLLASTTVVGVVDADGSAIAFPRAAALAALDAGEPVVLDGVMAVADGSGLRLVDGDGKDLASSEASWFAWSQTFPNTALWVPPAG